MNRRGFLSTLLAAAVAPAVPMSPVSPAPPPLPDQTPWSPRAGDHTHSHGTFQHPSHTHTHSLAHLEER